MSDLKKLRRTKGAFLFAAVFAVSFGGVGAFTSWVVGATLWDAWQAEGWARVPAEVVVYEGGAVQYRYEFGGRTFDGTRIGIAAIDTDEGNPEAGSRIQRAVNDRTPLEVRVNPEEPSQSVVDNSIPWPMVIGFLPFALGFGAVGLGALGVMVAMALPEREEEEQVAIASDAASGFLGLVLFTFIWNALAFPIAAVVVLETWKDGDWAGLFVLIFPLVGLLLIWGTVNSGINWIRRGGAMLHPQQMPPRLGSPFSGHVAFRRGVTPGDTFKAVLSCTTAGSGKNAAHTTHYKVEQQGRVAEVGGNHRLAFSLRTPERLEGFDRDAETSWAFQLFPEGKDAAAFTFGFKMQPPAGVEHLPEEDLRPAMVGDEDEELVPAGIPKGLEGVAALVGKERIEERLEQMPASQRAELHARLEKMTPGQKAALAKVGQYAHYMPMVKKLVFWAIGLFVLIQVIGVVSVILSSS